MDILNEFLEGTGKNSKDITLVILILILVFGFGKDTGLNLFNNGDVRNSTHHRKHRRDSCSSSGG